MSDTRRPLPPLLGRGSTNAAPDGRRRRWPSIQQILKSQLLPVVRELRVSAVTESRIRQLITGLRDTGLSARPTNLTLLVLKMILRTAVRRRYLRDDPTETIRSLREPRTEVDPLDPEEVTAFLVTCPVWWRPYFTVACWTGARPNELAALRWGGVDGGRGIVRIRASRYRGKEGPPKTASSVRDIDLLPPVVDTLKVQKAQQASERLKAGRGAPEPRHDYVFTGPEGGLLNVNALRDRVWYRRSRRRACVAASCTRPGTPSPRTLWRRGKPRPGSPRCWGTAPRRCSSASTRGTSRTAPGAMGVRYSAG
jgi:integrase